MYLTCTVKVESQLKVNYYGMNGIAESGGSVLLHLQARYQRENKIGTAGTFYSDTYGTIRGTRNKQSRRARYFITNIKSDPYVICRMRVMFLQKAV